MCVRVCACELHRVRCDECRRPLLQRPGLLQRGLDQQDQARRGRQLEVKGQPALLQERPHWFPPSAAGLTRVCVCVFSDQQPEEGPEGHPGLQPGGEQGVCEGECVRSEMRRRCESQQTSGRMNDLLAVAPCCRSWASTSTTSRYPTST